MLLMIYECKQKMRDVVLAQIANLCQKRKVIYYTLDFKHTLFETNKDTAPTNHLPRLIFICANNHLYPITGNETRQTIFNQHANTGGVIKKYKAQQNFEHKVNKGTEEQVYVHSEYMCIYGLLEHIKEQHRMARNRNKDQHRMA